MEAPVDALVFYRRPSPVRAKVGPMGPVRSNKVPVGPVGSVDAPVGPVGLVGVSIELVEPNGGPCRCPCLYRRPSRS